MSTGPLIEVNVRVRPVEASHISDLITLGEAANLSPWSAANYLDEMKNPDSVILRLVTAENETTGFIVGRMVVGGQIETVLDAEIYNIAVDAGHRRHGLAQVLLNEFLERCRSREVANVWLEVRESNTPAIRFYEKNGFQTVQTRRNFYRDPQENALLMRLFLKPTNA